MVSNLCKQARIVNRSAYVWRATKSLRTIKANIGTCPRCSSKLYSGDTAIPVDNDYVAIVPGEKCQRCDCLYITDKCEVEHLLQDNKNAKEYTLNGLPLWNYTAKRKEERRKEQLAKLRSQKIAKLRNIPSGVVLLTVQFADSAEDYIIVNKAKGRDERANILRYSDAHALELLTAAFKESRSRKGECNGKNYRIADVIFPQSKSEGLERNLLPTELNIQSGGGFPEKESSEEVEYREIVHVLLYSPFTERYEMIRATYDRLEGYCYTDATLYREFVSKYGKPDLLTGFGSRTNWDTDWSDLQIESALKQYGYSVGQKDGFSERYRQELLAELVDLELLDIPKIVRLLSFFISSHTSPANYIARSKWESDRAFISAYKANPERFLIKL